MRALVMKGNWHLEVEDLPTPRPAPGEVLVGVIATGICGSDLHGFTGENGRRFPGQVMGHETVGRITALGDGLRDGLGDAPGGSGDGSGARRLSEGQLVTVNPVIACGTCEACRADAQQRCPSRRVIGVDPLLRSAFAEEMAVPAANVVPLPEGAPVEHGALVEPLAVGYHAAVRGGCRPGERVLVIGGGPIGQAAALGALRLGARSVAVSEPRPARRALLRRLGVGVVDPTAGDDGDLTGLVRDALGGRPTLTLDAVGASGTLADALATAELGARIVLVGMHAPRVDLPAYAVSTGERTLLGSFCYAASEFAETARWTAETGLDLSVLVEGRVRLDDAPGSFASLARGENPASKVLVHPGPLPPAPEAPASAPESAPASATESATTVQEAPR